MAPKRSQTPTVFIRFDGLDRIKSYRDAFDKTVFRVHYVPEQHGYVVHGELQGNPFKLVTKRKEIKIFRHLDTVADLLRELNVVQFTVIS